jgi:hypothetical protein
MEDIVIPEAGEEKTEKKPVKKSAKKPAKKEKANEVPTPLAEEVKEAEVIKPATDVEKPEEPIKEEPKKEETKKRVVSDYFGNGAPEMEAPPDEEVTGGNVYFDESNAPLPKTEPKKTEIKPAPIGDAKATFGTFLRSLRKIGKSGVLFAICMDMEYAYEDGAFTLYTQSDTIYRSLCKDEHQALLKSAFEAIGINQNAFAVKMKGKATDDIDKGLQALKNDFQGVKMDIK